MEPRNGGGTHATTKGRAATDRESILARENARLFGVLRQARSRLDHALSGRSSTDASVRKAAETARALLSRADEGPSIPPGDRGEDGGSEQEEKGRINPPPSDVLARTDR